MASTDSYFSAIDGIRALAHISIVFLHAAMLTTAHLPSDGPLWMQFKHSKWVSSAMFGGIQVDIMFMLSGFLLVYKCLSDFDKNPNSCSSPNTLKRILRLLPCIAAVSIIGLLMGDSWDIITTTSIPSWKRIATLWTFIQNYLPAEDYGSFTLSLCWSCCVDLQIGVLIQYFMKFLTSITSKSVSNRPVVLAYRMRWAFILFLAIALAIRRFLFEKDSLNLFLLGQYSHFGLLQSDASYEWITTHYGHGWKTSNSASALSMVYINGMYQPLHTRFGPFIVGGILACNIFLSRSQMKKDDKSNKTKTKQNVFLRFVNRFICLILTILSVTVLIVPCFPAAETAPIEAQIFATVALRIASASAVAFLLFRCLIPLKHPFHWKSANAIFSSNFFKPIARLSFCSYLLHFRILMELNFDKSLRSKFVLWNGLYQEPTTADEWVEYMKRLFVVGLIISLVLSFFMRVLVELPCEYFFKRLFSNRNKKIQ